MFGFGFVCVVESMMMSVPLRDWPAVHHAVLVLDVYTVVVVAGLHAASVVRPHVLDPDGGTLRIRRAVHVDLRIPLERIASVRRELRATHERTDGELDLAVGARTSVTLELAEPVAHATFFGGGGARCASCAVTPTTPGSSYGPSTRHGRGTPYADQGPGSST